jgi:hypothetical protein
LVRTTDEVLARDGALNDYIANGARAEAARADPDVEAVFSLLATRIAQGRPLNAIRGVSIPPEDIALAPPESRDAAQTYLQALSLVNEYLGGGFGDNEGRRFQLAILLTQWMRGRPLSVLINDRLTYRRRVGTVNTGAEIRAVMFDVEQYARFQAPKYLAAYSDVLKLAFAERGVDIAEATFDLSVMLELGVSRTTDVSMMALGLSRTATIAIADYVVRDDLTPDGAMDWLRTHDLDRYPVPSLVKREIANRLAE